MLFFFVDFVAHDESTFRSGDICAKRWFFEDCAPFYSKGRGRSMMISDFLVMHPSGPLFGLDTKDYEETIGEFPELEDSDRVNYVKWGATGSIDVVGDSYFNNSTVLH